MPLPILDPIDGRRIGVAFDANGAPTTDLETQLSSLTNTTGTITSKVSKAGDSMTGPLTLSGDPTIALHAVTKQYVDNIAQGLTAKAAVAVATTGNTTLSGEQTIDGVLTSNSRVWVRAQTNAAQNGIHVTGPGAWTRAPDMDTWAEVPGAFAFVQRGTLYGGSGFSATAVSNGTLGTTPITVTQFSSAGSYSASNGVFLQGTDFRLSSMPAYTLKGNNAGVGAIPGDLNATDVRTMLSISNVDNTSDANKPVSTAVATQLNLKAALASPTFTGTPLAPTATAGTNNTQIATTGFVTTAVGTREPVITPGVASQYWRGDKSWATLDKSAVGLSNVDNTSDANKPVSTPQQTALNAKLDASVYTASDILSKISTSPIFAQSITTYGSNNVRMKTANNTTGYGAVWRVSSTNLTLRFTALDDADGAVNALTPLTVSMVDGAATMLALSVSSLTIGGATPYTTSNKPVKADVGLGNVDNTSDANKPVSNATATALSGKAATGAVESTGITMSTNRLLGRGTAGTGVIEEITAGSNLTLSGTALALNDVVTLTTASEASVTAPNSGSLRVFGRDMASRPMLGMMDNNGDKAIFGTHFGRNNYAWWKPTPASATVPAGVGLPAPTSLGTPTARTPSVTTMATRAFRLGYVTAATAGSFAGHYFPSAWWTTGDGATPPSGGFHMFYRFTISDPATVSGARMFVGLSGTTTAPTNVEPNTLIQSVGVAQLSTSTNLFLVYGGTAAQTAINLGSNFPALAGELYELQLFSPPAALRTIGYRLERISTGQVVSGTLNGLPAAVPSFNSQLAPRAWRTNNASALAVGLDIIQLVIESDN